MDYLKTMFMVGCGGFIGASLRYSIGLLDVKWDFPIITFVINILGSVLIGFVVELSARMMVSQSPMTLLFKTGLCGGFTTFSTFSLENLTLLENNHVKTAASYMVLSVVCCIIGVKIGRMMAAGVYLMLASQPVHA